jgi:hypothetical protein
MKKDVCVVIPVYKEKMSEMEFFSFKRMIDVFSNRDIFLVSPMCLEECVKEIAKCNKINHVLFNDIFFKNIAGYNKLLTNLEFYYKFEGYEYILICQLDVYVINDTIDFWIEKNMDYIGAPIFKGYTKSKNEIVMKNSGANGGFCLKKVSSSIEVLSKIGPYYSKINTLWKMESNVFWKFFRLFRDGIIFNYKINFLKPKINEDVFWSIIIPERFPFYKVLPPQEAAYFAFDANPRYLYEFCSHTYPMAIHAWWRYDKEFVMSIHNQIEKNSLHKDTNAC